MQIIQGKYTDFDNFKNEVLDWSLDFNILSKQDFYAEFKMFNSENFLLSKESLNAKIEHSGLSPFGFRTMVVPVHFNQSEFIWYNKVVKSKELLLFPKNRIIDTVTFKGLDIYLISIEETKLAKMIDNLGFNNCKAFFDNDELGIVIDGLFTMRFNHLANLILSTNVINKIELDIYISEISYLLLHQIEYSKPLLNSKPKMKKAIALQKAIEIIHEQEDILYSVEQLCSKVGVSQKTLFSAFLEKYKLTPSEYLKAYRLNRVKRELSSTPNKNISYVAGIYNFWHMGQFAKDFKKHFGILPSEV